MRRSLEWLVPGLGFKRWIVLALAGGVLLVYSVIFAVGVLWSPQLMRGLGMGWLENRHWAAVLLSVDGMAVGMFALAYGARRVWLFQKTTPETAGEIRAASRLARGPRVVAVGGGNGLAALLRGLKSHTSNLTAVVTMADDGGSSGLLRRDMGMPPPGDLRNCLVALADDESMMSQLFKYRCYHFTWTTPVGIKIYYARLFSFKFPVFVFFIIEYFIQKCFFSKMLYHINFI